jgi:hypothetical protein
MFKNIAGSAVLPAKIRAMSPDTVPHLPLPPAGLTSGDVSLAFVKIVPGDDAKGFAPAYHFRILVGNHDAGHINFRVGESEHVRICAGHIGFEVSEAFRGHGYALQACQALAPFVRIVYPTVILTCDPENTASRRTIEKLSANFIDETRVPRTIRTSSAAHARSCVTGGRLQRCRAVTITE